MQDQNLQFAQPYPQPNAPQGFKGPNQQFVPPPYPNPFPPQQAPNTDFEESYIENIIRLNRGKVGTFYMTYNDSLEYRDKVYRGIIQAAGKDHLVISDTRDGKRYILLLVYLDYVEFDEPINYEYPIN